MFASSSNKISILMCSHILAHPFSFSPFSYHFFQSWSDYVAIVQNFSLVLLLIALPIYVFSSFFSFGNSYPLFLHIFPLLQLNYFFFWNSGYYWHFFLSSYLLVFYVFYLFVFSVFLWESFSIDSFFSTIIHQLYLFYFNLILDFLMAATILLLSIIFLWFCCSCVILIIFFLISVCIFTIFILKS